MLCEKPPRRKFYDLGGGLVEPDSAVILRFYDKLTGTAAAVKGARDAIFPRREGHRDGVFLRIRPTEGNPLVDRDELWTSHTLCEGDIDWVQGPALH